MKGLQPDFSRSANMAAVRSSNTEPELLLRKALFRLGFRYRITPKSMKGRPDIVLPKYNAVIFVHGCFWHGHWCPRYHIPKSNSWFWTLKIQRNQIRDQDDRATLLEQGWRVAVVWECVIKGPKRESRLDNTVAFLATWISLGGTDLELPPSITLNNNRPP